MKVKLAATARADLITLYEFIRADNPAAAGRTVATILRRLDQLAELPLQGRPGRIEGTRELVVSTTGYVAGYVIKGEDVVVLAIRHGKQDWPK